jgi:hypothetical protein
MPLDQSTECQPFKKLDRTGCAVSIQLLPGFGRPKTKGVSEYLIDAPGKEVSAQVQIQ